MSDALLEVNDLQTHFQVRGGGVVRAVDGVSFSLARGEILGLVGESGSGKSQTGYSIMGLVEPPGRVVGGSIRLEGEELVGLPQRAWRTLRGRRVAMIFQDPMMTLNPVLQVGTQMTEAILAHRRTSRAQALEESHAALARVGIPSPGERLRSYPHQLSGGMRQRVVIAIAMLNQPALFIADEPTTALDVTIQGQILYEMQKITRETGASLIWITHDMAVVAALAQRVCVMHRGKIVEQGAVDAILNAPQHPYTQGLMDSIPSRNQRGQRLRTMPVFASDAPAKETP